MTYMSQENKKKLAPAILSICKQYGIKATLAVHNHSTLILNIKSGEIDFMEQYNKDRKTCIETENEIYGRENVYSPALYCDIYPPRMLGNYTGKLWSGKALEFLQKVAVAMHKGNHDNSDIMTDYFDVGWYPSIKIGQYEKPYIFTPEEHKGIQVEKLSIFEPIKTTCEHEIIEHTTKRGKVLRGIIRTDLDKEQAQEIDAYTFKKDGGWFIREKHLENMSVEISETVKTEHENTEEPPQTEVISFEPGKTYFSRSICDHNTIYKLNVSKRTAKTITTTEGKVYRPSIRENSDGKQVERVSMGNYSMAGSWYATDTTELLPDWEKPQPKQEKAIVEEEHQEDGARWFICRCGKTRASIYISSLDYVQICTLNASHAAFRGLGTMFKSLEEALIYYKSKSMQSIISLVTELVGTKPEPPKPTKKTQSAPVLSICPAPVTVETEKQPEPAQIVSVELVEPLEPSAPKAKPFPVADLPENDEQFYPTPKNLADIMRRKIEGNPRNIIDPSAGKGDLLDSIKESYHYTHYQKPNLFAIEIDSNLRTILQGKKYRVIDSDFLAWAGPDKFDCIIMNPPFQTGASHLLKAIDVLYSGQIICLLNAETLRNPCTNMRKELVRKLEEIGAEIEYKENQFLGAERKTAVDIALVNIKVNRQIEDDLFDGTTRTAGTCHESVGDNHEVSTGRTIEELAAEFRQVVNLTTETIVNFYRNHNKVGRYVSLNAEPDSRWATKEGQELTLKVQETVNSTVRTIRVDYWRRTLELPEVKGRLTEKRRAEFEEMLKSNESMDFTESNIRQFLLNLIAGYDKTLQDGVDEVFDLLTIRNSYHEELHTKNIHYFNGWKTNNAYRVGRRVIIPVYGSYGGPFTDWGKWSLNWQAERSLDDVDLVMSYFNGGRPYKSLTSAIKEAFSQGENSGKSTFFKFTCHKKGTIHLTFTDENILRRFNVAACKGKEWLPGDYGKKAWNDLNRKEREVAETFEDGGEKVYTENLNQNLFDATIDTLQLIEA